MSKRTQIGELNRRVEIIKYDYTQETNGGPAHSEDSIGEVWAKVIDISGTEETDGAVIALNIRKYVVMFQDILASDGVTFFIKDLDGEYNIHSVEHEGYKEYLILKASKRD